MSCQVLLDDHVTAADEFGILVALSVAARRFAARILGAVDEPEQVALLKYRNPLVSSMIVAAPVRRSAIFAAARNRRPSHRP